MNGLSDLSTIYVTDRGHAWQSTDRDKKSKKREQGTMIMNSRRPVVVSCAGLLMRVVHLGHRRVLA
jgi:hypothetical protein